MHYQEINHFIFKAENVGAERAKVQARIDEIDGEIHAQDEAVIRRFALEIPVSRFLVNTPAALGGIGHSTGLFPALTLGCGAVGGSSSSNNISPMDLINVRRVAWDTEKIQEKATQPVDSNLIDLLAEKILERLK